MMARLFHWMWLIFIFALGFSSGIIFREYRHWKNQSHDEGFLNYVSDTLHLSQEQRDLLERAMVSKDKHMDQLKRTLQ